MFILYSAKPVFKPRLGKILCSSDLTMIFSESSGFDLFFLTWYPLTTLSDLKEWSPSVIEEGWIHHFFLFQIFCWKWLVLLHLYKLPNQQFKHFTKVTSCVLVSFTPGPPGPSSHWPATGPPGPSSSSPPQPLCLSFSSSSLYMYKYSQARD